MKLANLINLKPLKEGAFGMSAKDLADNYSLERLQTIRDEVMGDMEQVAEPEGGRIADTYADQLHGLDQAIAIKKGESGEMTYGDMLHKHYPDKYGPGGIAKDKDTFTKSSKFDRGIGEGKIGANSWKTRTAVNTAPGVTEDKEIIIDNIDDLNNITIRWRGANHWGNKTLTNLKFEKENEFDDDLMAISNDSKWLFIVDLDEETGEVDWDTLMVDSRELENVADDGTSTYSVPDEDIVEDHTRTKHYSAVEVTKSMWNRMDGDAKMDALLTVFKDPKEAEKYLDSDFDNLPPNSAMTVDEGTCGHGPNGVLGDTPGGTKGMDADDRTRGMIRKFIKKEIKKLHETDEEDRLANSGTDSDGRNTWGDKTGYSDKEMAQGKGKLKKYPDKDGRNVWGDKTDYSDKEKAKLNRKK